MKYNKRKGFTLAEVMILLATLTVLMAAFAPVFTRRYTASSLDDVWSFVPADAQNDAYYDATNKKYTAQAFIGLTPVSKSDVNTMTKDNEGKTSYSKLVIAASKSVNVGGGKKVQNQIQFRYGNSAAGALVGNLFAGNNNLLLGGLYDSLNVTTNPDGNTAYGYNAMSALTNGNYNTAVGRDALENLTSGKNNVGIGVFAGEKLTSGNNNTILGLGAGEALTLSSNNTFVGLYAGSSGFSGNNNTAVGNYSLNNGSGNGNTAVGVHAMDSAGAMTANNNVAVGSYAMSKLITGNYNTAIGYNSCLSLEKGSYKTCIGAYSGSPVDVKIPNPKLFTGDTERVFIGSIPRYNNKKDVPAALLEVHNVKTSVNPNSLPIGNAGNESVIINGNLVVRGQTYLETILYRYDIIDSKKNPKYANKGLVWHMADVAGKNSAGKDIYGLMGFDGMRRDGHSYQVCRNCGRGRHDYSDIRTNCICTAVTGRGTLTTTFSGSSSPIPVSKSYDWTSRTSSYNGTKEGNCDAECDNCNNKASYTDRSFGTTVYLERRPVAGVEHNGTDKPLAHMKDIESCCPDITSDVRLKNVGERFTAGLSEIKKLNVYNYTFKNDPNKLPQVGVIAQDLKMVFPNAVTKGEDGYYKIRWDEMLYAAINAVKELNTKVAKIADRIETDRNRVAQLKKDNAALNAQLDKLSDEVVVLETKKHK